MPYYEVIRETGGFSVMNADTDEEALEGIREAHHRAVTGKLMRPTSTSSPHPSGQNDHPRDPAERIVAVHVYDDDPGTLSVEQAATPEALTAAVKQSLKDHDKTAPLSAEELGKLQAAVTPQAITDSDPHESNYAAEPTRTLDPSLWQKEPTPA